MTKRQHQMLAEARRRCRSKRLYQSWVQAEQEALELIDDLRDGRLRIKKGLRIFAYRCFFGEHWHIGHQKPRVTSQLAFAVQQEALVA